MIIKYVKLHNIRSYINQEVKFPTGITLLSGDIGSGKSTILLSIEFALFGIKRGDLSGEALLRNGKNLGVIELCFEVDGKEIIISRKLKRGKNGITQDSGWIEVDGKRKEASPVELKAEVLQLLGYPDELLTKGKDILFRYTVYTPQEEMKQILLESKEARLDTLRRVFQIDRYKRIRDNSSIFIKELKERKKELEGRIADIDDKKKRLSDEKETLEKQKEKIVKVEPLLKDAQRKIERRKEGISALENEIKKLNDYRKELKVKEVDLINKLDQQERNKRETESLSKEISLQNAEELEKTVEEGKEVSKISSEKKKSIEALKKNMLETRRKIADCDAIVRQAEEVKRKIGKLAKCPVCEQVVGEEHKHSISDREDTKILEMKEKLEKENKILTEAEKEMQKLESDVDELRNRERKSEMARLKLQNLQKEIERQKRIFDDNERISRDISAIKTARIEILKKVKEMKDSEEKYEAEKKVLDAERDNARKIEVEHAGLKREIELRQGIISGLEKEIGEKEGSKLKIVKLSQYINWIDEFFVNLMSTMEKHVMAKIHGEFNELFQQWFNVLIEDQNLNVKIDDEFTPVVEQNGYETEINNLSGGEKTSCALAYRLALNRVVNDLVTTIKTKDLIILDEPTDGFSTEQLDRVRDVIEQIKMKQVIIVSHEQKIESFVDNVVRVQKKEHVSEASFS